MRFFFWVSVQGGPLEPAEVTLRGTVRIVQLIGRDYPIMLGEDYHGIVVYGEIKVPEWTTVSGRA